MVIAVRNVAKCIKKFKNIDSIDIMPVIKTSTRKVQRSAKEFAPVYPSPKAKPPYDKNHIGGTLRDNIHVKFEPNRQEGIVFINLDYAPHQEFGTVFQEGTPFLLPAMAAEGAGIEKDIENYLRNNIKRKAA
jgi:hypothetical protein